MALPSTNVPPVLSIALQRDLLQGEWMVTRLDLEVGVVRNQTRFKIPVPALQALCEQFTQIFLPLLPVLPQAHVYADDEAAFDLPHTKLFGIRVVVQRAFGGLQTAVIRFRQVAGSVQSLLVPAYQVEKSIAPSFPGQSGAPMMKLDTA